MAPLPLLRRPLDLPGWACGTCLLLHTAEGTCLAPATSTASNPSYRRRSTHSDSVCVKTGYISADILTENKGLPHTPCGPRLWLEGKGLPHTPCRPRLWLEGIKAGGPLSQARGDARSGLIPGNQHPHPSFFFQKRVDCMRTFRVLCPRSHRTRDQPWIADTSVCPKRIRTAPDQLYRNVIRLFAFPQIMH